MAFTSLFGCLGLSANADQVRQPLAIFIGMLTGPIGPLKFNTNYLGYSLAYLSLLVLTIICFAGLFGLFYKITIDPNMN